MENRTIENQLHLDNAGLNKRNALLEETLQKKEGLLESLKDSEKQYRRLFESAKDGKRVIQCNIRDITARKQVERIMAEKESKMRSILDDIGIGVALISPEMIILEP